MCLFCRIGKGDHYPTDCGVRGIEHGARDRAGPAQRCRGLRTRVSRGGGRLFVKQNGKTSYLEVVESIRQPVGAGASHVEGDVSPGHRRNVQAGSGGSAENLNGGCVQTVAIARGDGVGQAIWIVPGIASFGEIDASYLQGGVEILRPFGEA